MPVPPAREDCDVPLAGQEGGRTRASARLARIGYGPRVAHAAAGTTCQLGDSVCAEVRQDAINRFSGKPLMDRPTSSMASCPRGGEDAGVFSSGRGGGGSVLLRVDEGYDDRRAA